MATDLTAAAGGRSGLGASRRASPRDVEEDGLLDLHVLCGTRLWGGAALSSDRGKGAGSGDAHWVGAVRCVGDSPSDGRNLRGFRWRLQESW